MGTFEKLGILVIVVIIVMILAVAIYQWGGTATGTDAGIAEIPQPLTVKYIDELIEEGRTPPAADDEGEGTRAAEPAADGATWPGGIPKRYTVEKNDRAWLLVVREWGLQDGFLRVLDRANPGIDFERLRPGQELVVPDPAPYRRRERGTPAGKRTYEVQIGDNLETIARSHLGSRIRWKEIVELNPGLRPERLREGQTIVLPAR